MKHVMLSLLLTALYCCSTFAQKQTGDAKTQAPCSPAVTEATITRLFLSIAEIQRKGKGFLGYLKLSLKANR